METKMKLPIIVCSLLVVISALTIIFYPRKTQEDLDVSKLFETSTEEEASIEPLTEDYIAILTTSAPTIKKETTTKKVVPTKETTTAAQTTKKVVKTNTNYDDERDILAKLLYCESGGESWNCQVYTCSAILNLSDYYGRSISNMASDVNLFSVAPWVWNSTPTQTQYDVIDHVLSGGRIEDVKWFRMDRYHSFATPVTCIDNTYFSK